MSDTPDRPDASGEDAGANPNVDAAEVAQFDRMADAWWDLNGPLRTLHHLNPTRLEFVLEGSGGVDGRTCLDVGCGGGVFSEALASAGGRVTGIDLGAAALTTARLHRHESGVEVDYVHVAAEDFAEQHPGAFDVVSCLELLEHVPDPSSTVRACAELTAPGGHVFFSTLNRTPKAWALAVIGAEYIAGLLPRGTHEYRRFIRPSELDRVARACGLTLQRLAGMAYNPATTRASLSDDVSVNYLAHYRRDA